MSQVWRYPSTCPEMDHTNTSRRRRAGLLGAEGENQAGAEANKSVREELWQPGAGVRQRRGGAGYRLGSD